MPMRRELSPEMAKFRADLRVFFTTQVPGDIREAVASGHELTKDHLVRAQRVLNQAGLAVPHWSPEWGGRNWSPLQRYLWEEEMQLAWVPAPIASNTVLIGPVLQAFGSDALKERFLPATANADIFWCQGFSEPEAGSDLASLRTRAVRDGDSWVINGQKTWTTQGQFADWMFCLVRTDPKAAKRQSGISMIVIPMDAPGVTLRPIELIDGTFEVNDVFLDDVRVPADHLIGEENRGWSYAKYLLSNERTTVANGTKPRLALLKQRAADAGLLTDSRLAARIVELETDLLALELTALRVAANPQPDKPHPASSVLKLRGSGLQQAVSALAVDLAGEVGLSGISSTSDEWLSRSLPTYLNLRKVSIYGGSDEIQRSIIASTILGL